MIGWLNGKIIEKNHPGKITLDINGVGYDVETSLQTFFQIEMEKNNVGLYIHTVVREDALLLYGFLTQEERALFRSLIKVNGVGPKLAITILSSTSPGAFIQCIEEQNTLYLTKLPGIGKKTAERLVVEMKDSIKQLPWVADVTPKALSTDNQREAITALESLGYKNQGAFRAIKKIYSNNKSCEQLIREALQILAGIPS